MKLPLLTCFASVFFTISANCQTDLSGLPPCGKAAAGRLVAENLLGRDYMTYEGTSHEEGLHYAEACAAVGALRLAGQLKDEALLEKLIRRYEAFLKEDNNLATTGHVDRNVVGILPLQIYLQTGDERYLKAGLALADQQWEDPREDGLTGQSRFWIDDMYMVGMLQVQAYRATGEPRYVNRAARQLAAYMGKLQQGNGLFYHGPDFHYHWGRGNGWVAAAMAEVLDSLPDGHELRPFLMEGYRHMMVTLLSYQAENGMWRQVIDYEYAWTESSCTGMFAYAMAVGVDNGWLEGEEWPIAVEKAYRALCGHLDRAGNLREICVGTGQRDDIEYYLNRPRTLGDLHGQAPFLWLVARTIGGN